MRCTVVVLFMAVLVASTTGAVTPSCSTSQEFFVMYNASADDNSAPGPTCKGSCCGRRREAQLKSTIWEMATRRAADVISPMIDLLLATQRTLIEHLQVLSHQSQNRTAFILTRLYKKHSMRVHPQLAALYSDIWAVLGPVTGTELDNPPNRDLLGSSRKFFRDIFPVAYHNMLKLEGKMFKPEYEACLKDAFDAVQPFGEVPHQLGTTLTKSMNAARILLQVLSTAASALAATEEVLAQVNEVCSVKMLEAIACGRCRGYEARPCRNYCLNVARGCVGSVVSDLDIPWTSFVEDMGRVTRIDADPTLRALDERVSEAIMHALENKLLLDKKVRQECGAPLTVEISDPSPVQSQTSAHRDVVRVPPVDVELLQFAASIANRKQLFAKLADRLCEQLDFSEDGNDQCWTGHNVADYSKPLALSSSISDQMYNPEITDVARDARVTRIGDKLQHARQSLVKSWGVIGGAPMAEPFIQGDEADDEGSGSGHSYADDDASYDAEEGSGTEEGSGHSPITRTRGQTGAAPAETTTPKTKGAHSSRPLVHLITGVAAVLSFSHAFT